MVAAPTGDKEGCGPTLAGQPPIYNRLAWSEVLGRCQRPGAATPALDTEGEAFGDRDEVPPLGEPFLPRALEARPGAVIPTGDEEFQAPEGREGGTGRGPPQTPSSTA